MATVVKAYPADVYLIKLKSSGKQIMSSYNKLTLKPYHVQREYPSIDAKTQDREEGLEKEMDQESEKEDSEESDDNFDNEEVYVAHEETTETETFPRRSTREQEKWLPSDIKLR